MTRRRGRRAWAGRMFVAPNLAAVVVFMLFPLGFSLYMSFQKWDLFTHATFVRLDNFRNLFTSDPLFLIAVVNTAVYTVGTVVPTVIVSLVVAAFLNRKIKGISLFRTVVFLPLAISSVVMAVVWQFVFNTDNGLLNIMLGWLGIGPIPWLIEPRWAMVSLPGQRLAQCALRHGRPAGRDAGGSGDCVRGGQDRWCRRDSPVRVHHGTADPGALSFVVVISIIHAFQAFDLVYVLTGANGGPETATYVLGIMLFQHAFSFLEFGYASALAWVMFAILLVLTVLQLRITHRRSWEASRGLG